ncbi:hypothetical protein C4564_01680 [Candidatus Microgenomates bacterium]|nr:MAG: hypothetical protein C4564_01680 [Candidatus Microgenomates bacterium]
MNTEHKKKRKEDIHFPTFAVTGGMVALILFFSAFLVTSRANTPHPQSNLVLPIPAVPEYENVAPRTVPLAIFDNNVATSPAIPEFSEALQATEASTPIEIIEPLPSFTPDFESSPTADL